MTPKQGPDAPTVQVNATNLDGEAAGSAPQEEAGANIHPGARPATPVGAIWEPAGGARCREPGCGAPIRFRKTLANRWQPMEFDGSDVHYHKKPRAQVCPFCGSALFSTIYTVPKPHYARAECVCGRSWWLAKPVGERP